MAAPPKWSTNVSRLVKTRPVHEPTQTSCTPALGLSICLLLVVELCRKLVTMSQLVRTLIFSKVHPFGYRYSLPWLIEAFKRDAVLCHLQYDSSTRLKMRIESCWANCRHRGMGAYPSRKEAHIQSKSCTALGIVESRASSASLGPNRIRTVHHLH